jgi:hypothetical protein
LTQGTSSNPATDYAGTMLYAQAFASTGATLPLQTKTIAQTAGAGLVSSPAPMFALPMTGQVGVFYVMAFRDSNGDGVYTAGEPVTGSGGPTGVNAFAQGSSSACLNVPTTNLTLTPP